MQQKKLLKSRTHQTTHSQIQPTKKVFKIENSPNITFTNSASLIMITKAKVRKNKPNVT